MGVGRVGGGGSKGPAGGAKESSSSGKSEGGSFSSQVSRADGVLRSSGLVGTAGASVVSNAQMVLAQQIAGQLKSGQLKSKEEATKKFVSEILRERLRVKSEKLTEKVAEALQDDPRLQQALERVWSKAE